MFHDRLASGCSVLLVSLMMPAVYAQDRSYDPYGMPAPAGYYQPVSAQVPTQPPTPMEGSAESQAPFAPQQQNGYVRLGAPMYPTPRPNIPIWAGSTVITNQALAPHEMLYPHTYRALYPPYYHRVKGGWIVTPFGVRSHERWELQGTMVQVNYRSTYPGFFSGAAWHPPKTGNTFGSWR